MSDVEAPFYSVATHKFVLMSIATFGLYEIYWAYKNWQSIKGASGESLSPFWRAFFSPFWAFSLFRRVRNAAEQAGVNVWWSPPLFATLYFVILVTWRLPDPWWLISIGSLLPVLPVVQTIERVNATTGKSRNGSDYSALNIAAIVLGGLLVLAAIVGTFVPV